MSRKMILMNDLINEISMGPFGSDIKVDNFVSEGIPVLNGSNISGVAMKDGFDNFLIVDKADSLKKANAKRGDIVITHRGTLGQIAYIPDNSQYERYVISQSQFKVRLKTNLVNPIYFSYYFHTNEGQKRLLSFKSHVGVPALAQATTNFRQLEFPYIPLTDQNKIAKVLSDLDTKIELNNKINAELEAMAKLIYDYWFVQFDFPISKEQAKSMGKPELEGKPYKSFGGKMVWNEELRREIPEGWEVKELSTMLKSNYMSVNQKYEFDKMSYLDTSSLTKNYIESIQLLNCEKDKIPSRAKRLVQKNDILYSTVRPNLCHYGIIKNPCNDMVASTGFVQLSSKIKNVSNDLLYTFLTSGWVTERLHQIATLSVSSYPSISPNDILKLKICLPKSGIILEIINEKLDEIYHKVSLNQIENQKLAELRDWLLPMLMNGQVKVSSQGETLDIAAEPEAKYGKEISLNEKRKAIAACIIFNSEFEEFFGKVKFEKLLHLSEYHIVKDDLKQNYQKHAAGPLDSKFTYSFINEAEKEGMIYIQEMKPLHRIRIKDKQKLQTIVENELDQKSQEKIAALVHLFRGSNYEKPEIVSTLYAVWNNRIIKNELINDELIKKKFFDWSEGKIKYKGRLDRNLKWMRNNGIVPDGWGCVV